MLSTITDPERISREGRTRPSRAQSSRRKWEESWRCRRWAGYITATNDEPPEQRPSSLLIVPISDVVDLRFAPYAALYSWTQQCEHRSLRPNKFRRLLLAAYASSVRSNFR